MNDIPNGFEVFDPHHTQKEQGLSVTIQMRGNIHFDETVYQALGCPKAIKLYFHREKRLIGMRGIAEKERKSTKVCRANRGYAITAVTFVHVYDIDIQVARKYEAHMDGNMLIVDLNAFCVVARKAK